MEPARIENLNRITLQLKAGRTADTMDITDSEVGCEFIYGLGTGGLTEFEYALADMHLGESIQLHIQTQQIEKFFGHIHLPVFYNVGELSSFYLNVRIQDLRKAAPREVIKAMAAIAGCGCSCCGDHDLPVDSESLPDG